MKSLKIQRQIETLKILKKTKLKCMSFFLRILGDVFHTRDQSVSSEATEIELTFKKIKIYLLQSLNDFLKFPA